MFEDGYPGQPPGSQPESEPEAESPVSPSIPWQCKNSYPSVVSAMWETIKVVLLYPSRAFSNMRVENSLAQSLIYLLVLGSIGGIIGQVFQAALPLGVGMLGGEREGVAMGMGMFGFSVGLSIVIVPVAVVIGAFLGAAILHLCLMIVGGANRSFEATFSVVAYCGGSTALFQVIPVCGALIGAVWGIVVEIIGLAGAHQTSTGKAALAVFMPIIAGVFCCGILFVMGVGLAGFSAAMAD